ncbi:MAG: PilN domain-containing protein [Planctomycetota bacterium]
MNNPASFLPEEYVREALDRRTALIALLLFVIVMGSVFAAFLVTNRQWAEVRDAQAIMNDQTASAASEIEEMKSLEAMRAQMVEKADLARGLIEPVPRSVLLACLVNTMPKDLSLLELALTSEEVKIPRNATPAKADPKVRRNAQTKQPDGPPKPDPVRRRVAIVATGVAPSDLDVSRWMTALSRVAFLSNIRLEVSEDKDFDGTTLRQFKVSMRIEPDADVSGWAGIEDIRRPADPLSALPTGPKLPTLTPSGAGEKAPEAPRDAELAGASPALLPDDEVNE